MYTVDTCPLSLDLGLLPASRVRARPKKLAIHGHRVGHAVLDDGDEVASMFSLDLGLLPASRVRARPKKPAIHGHRVGHAVLDDGDEVASMFFLCERIFCLVVVATKPPA
jgi:hypothetical protein